MTDNAQPKIVINLSDQENPDHIVVKFHSSNNTYEFVSLSNFLRVFIYRLKYGHSSGMSNDLRMNSNTYKEIDILKSGYPLEMLWPNQPWRRGHIKARITLEFVTDAPAAPDPKPSPLDDLR